MRKRSRCSNTSPAPTARSRHSTSSSKKRQISSEVARYLRPVRPTQQKPATARPMNPANLPGKPLAEVDTPSLLLNADALEANLQRMASYFTGRHCKLRPHFKSHKCT